MLSHANRHVSRHSLVYFVGWTLLTSGIFVTKWQLDAMGETMRAERAENYVPKAEMVREFEIINRKLDKQTQDIVDIKVHVAKHFRD